MLFQVMKFDDLKELGSEAAVKVCVYSSYVIKLLLLPKMFSQHQIDNWVGKQIKMNHIFSKKIVRKSDEKSLLSPGRVETTFQC